MFTEQQKPLQKWETYLALLFVAATGYLYFFAPGPRTDNDASSGFLVYGGIGLLIFAGLSFIKWRQDSGIQGRSRLVFLHRSACIGLYVVTFLSICAVLFLLIMGGRAGERAETTNYLWIISFPFLGICGGYMIGFFIGIVIEVCRLFMGKATVPTEASSAEKQPPPLPTDSTTSTFSEELPSPDKSFAEENPWEAMKHNAMRFLRWVLPILKKGGEKAVEAAKKGGEVAVEATKKAAPHVKAQLDKIPVEAMKEQALQQVDKVPGGRRWLAVVAGAVFLMLVSGWWMTESNTKTPTNANDTFDTIAALQNEPSLDPQEEIDLFCSKYGTDITAKDNDGRTLLHKAASDWSEHVVRFLVDKGADVNAKTEGTDKSRAYGITPLHSVKTAEAAKFLIEKGANVNAKTTGSVAGITPLFWVENEDIAKLLIENGADVNARTHVGATPLHWVKNAPVAKYLVEKGGDINAKTQYDEMPLHRAKDVIAKFFIAKGADINAKSTDGDTPLHIALGDNKTIEVAKYLISKGAGINVKNKNGRMPIHSAAGYGDFEVVNLLVSKGADIHAKISDSIYAGQTPLHWASASNNDVEVAKLLVSKGADVNEKDDEGKTPLHVAAEKGNAEIAEFLIKKGSEIAATTTDKYSFGLTPLHMAAKSNSDTRTIELLLKHGAKINAIKDIYFEPFPNNPNMGIEFTGPDSLGTPLHLAAAHNKNADIARALVEHGANINAKTKKGQTPLDMAKEGGNTAVASYLAGLLGQIKNESSPQAQGDGSVNSEKNRKELLKRGEEGDMDAQYSLAFNYIMGLDGFPEDAERAAIWFCKAADQGHPSTRDGVDYRFIHTPGFVEKVDELGYVLGNRMGEKTRKKTPNIESDDKSDNDAAAELKRLIQDTVATEKKAAISGNALFDFVEKNRDPTSGSNMEKYMFLKKRAVEDAEATLKKYKNLAEIVKEIPNAEKMSSQIRDKVRTWQKVLADLRD